MKTKITTVLLLAGIAGFSLHTAQSAEDKAAPSAGTNAAVQPAAGADEVIVKGKGVSIKRSQLNEAMASIKAGMAAQGRQLPPAQLAEIEPQVLDRLIIMELLTSRATDADRAKAKELTTKRFTEIRTKAGSEEAIETQLKAVGLSVAEFQKKLAEEAVAEVVLERELKPEVSEADARKFYDENPARFESGEMVRASHILLMTKDSNGQDMSAEKKEEKHKLIEEILKKARAGEDFAMLAKTYSEDPGSKDKGGEYTFPRGQMVPEFEKAAFALKTNEVSDVVTTQYGYHIIKLSEKIPAKKESFDEVKSKIMEGIRGQKMQQGMAEVTEKLRKEADVQILDAKLKAAGEESAMNKPPSATPVPREKPQQQDPAKKQ